MFRFKKSTKTTTKTEILTSSGDIPTTTKDCKKLILDNTRWEASALFQNHLTQFLYLFIFLLGN